MDFEHGDRNAVVMPDGSFSTSLSPGVNNIDLNRITKEGGFYVKSIRSGTQDVLHNAFAVAAS